MEEILPSTRSLLEVATREMTELRDSLREECELIRDLLRSAQTRESRPGGSTDENSPAQHRANPVKMVKLKASSPACDKYAYKVKTSDSVYCFRSFDDLLSRVVAPEDLLGARDSKTREPDLVPETRIKRAIDTGRWPSDMIEIVEALNSYVETRRKPSPKHTFVMKKYVKKMDEMVKRENEMCALVDDNLVDDLLGTISKFQNLHRKKEVDYLRELKDKYKKYGEREENDFTEYSERIRNQVKISVTDDLRSKSYSEEMIPDLYKTAHALQDIRYLRKPVLIKKTELLG